ncbi:uncharacterized protein LOC124899493 [Capsicum annuum]|uniref:uncharacterized protein LOC124899493 n=1 Tax=Capsicum annuum TaxID=4072 RepID=UPI001FB072E4|nr:uncharacterized protein LOC124899493 [Capsicum annuum]
MGLTVYVVIRKEEKEFRNYPLCVSLFRKSCKNDEICSKEEGKSSCDSHKVKVNSNCVDGKKSNIGEDCFELIESVDTNDKEHTIISDPNHNEALICQMYALVYKSKKCGWFLRASSNKNTNFFKIKKFRYEHTCPVKDRVYQQKHEDIINELALDLNYTMAWRAKEKTLISLRGTTYSSYNRLPGYLYMFEKTYPGSHIRMKKTSDDKFLYVFISLYSSIKGFDSCRPIVVVDGSHLRGTYNGTFVSASTLNGAAWSWFFEQLKEAHGIKSNMCVVSDRNESIIRDVSSVYGGVIQKSHAKFSEVFYAMAKAYIISEFNSLMKKVEKIDIRVKDYLQSAGYNKWSRVYATINWRFTLTSNIAETINMHLKEARELPIYDFLEEVRKMFGRWNHSNRQVGTFTRTPVVLATDYVYSVLHEDRHFIVCLDKKTLLKSKHLEPDDYCSNFYKSVSILGTYDVLILPLPDRSTWKISDYILSEVVLQPKYKRPPGSPKKIEREKSAEEFYGSKSTYSCSAYGLKEHNRRSCREKRRVK